MAELRAFLLMEQAAYFTINFCTGSITAYICMIKGWHLLSSRGTVSGTKEITGIMVRKVHL
jgi:hypothetical protein